MTKQVSKTEQCYRWIRFLALALLSISLTACAELKELKPEPGPGAAIVNHEIFKPVKYQPMEGSLWPGDTSKNLLFGDTKARDIGDVVTVILNEDFTSSATATTATQKSSSINLQTGAILGLPSNLGINDFLGSGNQFNPRLDASTTRSNDGQGTTTRNGSMTGTMAATIVEKLPNDHYRIVGKRAVQFNNEEQQMVLTGIIRRVDITFTNTVNSSQIADARIALTGEGVVSDEQYVGWMTRFLAKVWPF